MCARARLAAAAAAAAGENKSDDAQRNEMPLPTDDGSVVGNTNRARWRCGKGALNERELRVRAANTYVLAPYSKSDKLCARARMCVREPRVSLGGS